MFLAGSLHFCGWKASIAIQNSGFVRRRAGAGLLMEKAAVIATASAAVDAAVATVSAAVDAAGSAN